MSEVTKASVATEGGHWYRCNDGRIEQIDEVIGRNGKRRKPTLRDARKSGGAWMPGVTTIMKMAAAPQLERWRMQQLCKATIELGGPWSEVDDDGQLTSEQFSNYCTRAMDRANEYAAKARDVGTEVHSALHRYVTCDQFRQEENMRGFQLLFGTYVTGVWRELREFFEEWETDQLEQLPDATDQASFSLWHGVKREDWRSEEAVHHPLGYATKADLWTPAADGWLFDFKGKQTAEDLKPTMYEQHHMQLAATREAIEHTHGVKIPHGHCRIIYFARDLRDQGQAMIADEDAKGIEKGWRMFKSLLSYWQSKNDYEGLRERVT